MHNPTKEKPPWGHNRIGKHSLEEIALEFILWEDAATHRDATRRAFIDQALDQSFAKEDRFRVLHRFLGTYERLYEKIYQRNQGRRVNQDMATPESLRKIVGHIAPGKVA